MTEKGAGSSPTPCFVHSIVQSALLRRQFFRDDVDAFALSVKEDDAVGQCEQRVVLAAADVAAGVEVGAALANDDAAAPNALAAVELDAQALAVRLAAVADRALTFLMSHVSFLVVVSMLS